MLKRIMLVLPLMVCHAAKANESDTAGNFSEPGSVWVNPGFFSYHFDRNIGFRGNNYGLGVQVAISQTNSIIAGVFRNSVDAHSRYAVWVWQPIKVGAVRLGLAAGAIDGYPKMHYGKAFLAVLPMASFEYKAIGANITIIPHHKDKLYEALVLQLKLRVW